MFARSCTSLGAQKSWQSRDCVICAGTRDLQFSNQLSQEFNGLTARTDPRAQLFDILRYVMLRARLTRAHSSYSLFWGSKMTYSLCRRLLCSNHRQTRGRRATKPCTEPTNIHTHNMSACTATEDLIGSAQCRQNLPRNPQKLHKTRQRSAQLASPRPPGPHTRIGAVKYLHMHGQALTRGGRAPRRRVWAPTARTRCAVGPSGMMMMMMMMACAPVFFRGRRPCRGVHESDGDRAHWRLCGGYKIVYQ